ncbi:hypothetical protein [Haloarchaeobius litoreus]|uniref:Uncharacterized protein n=1 Tax=Haloarchaeobius litoreus TaxID=755306 RepID=A0ABD6DH39_9EURY|nr:hypothetical protein [Haloarchaeobius litoreus]
MSEKHPEITDALDSTWSYSTNEESDNLGDSAEKTANGDISPSFDTIRTTVLDEFDDRIWLALEGVLSAQATLLLADVEACTGIVITGASGTGKTTLLRFIEDMTYDGEDLVYKCDDFTHAAFVSHDTSKDEEELAEIDLLPQIQNLTLAAMDMNTWFSGSEEKVKKNLSYFARVMDGNGLTRNTGGHGQRGYEGDYRFVLAGATTPIQSRVWDVMGNVGNRLLFHEMPRKDNLEAVTDDVFGDTEYKEKVARCRSVVGSFMKELWQTHGGYGSVSWQTKASNEVQEAIAYLANLVSHARAPVEQVGGQVEPQREGAHRVMMALKHLARGHAFLCGRTRVKMDDVEVCARVALSTMHRKRRGIIRAVVDPTTAPEMTASEIETHDATEASRKTILKRMNLLNDLDIGLVTKRNTGRDTTVFVLAADFAWPDQLPFPE